MTSFQMPISEKDRKIGRSIHKVHKAIAGAVVSAKKESGITQQSLAEKMGVNRSVVNRRVTGQTNLTLQSLAELAWALDRELVVDLVRPKNLQNIVHHAVKPSNLEGHWVAFSDELSSNALADNGEVNRWFSLIRNNKVIPSFSSATNDNSLEDVSDTQQPEAA